MDVPELIEPEIKCPDFKSQKPGKADHDDLEQECPSYIIPFLTV